MFTGPRELLLACIEILSTVDLRSGTGLAKSGLDPNHSKEDEDHPPLSSYFAEGSESAYDGLKDSGVSEDIMIKFDPKCSVDDTSDLHVKIERSAQLAAVAMIVEGAVTVATENHSTRPATVLLDTGAQQILNSYRFAGQLQRSKDYISASIVKIKTATGGL
eukprot:SM000076S21872  [mRNA]  locus=s76:576431:577888:- [translate_table: standard]